MIIWILFLALDIWKNSQGQRKSFAATVGIRVGVCIVALVVWAASHKEKFRRHIQPFLAMVIIIFGTSQVLFGVIETDTLDPTVRNIACFTTLCCSLTMLHCARSIRCRSF